MSSDKKLEAIYFNTRDPGSFGGPSRLSTSAKISYSQAKDFLEHYNTYTENKSVRNKFQRRKISSHEIDFFWQADLIDVTKYARLNKGNKFLLTVIDVLSRQAFVRPLRNKTGKSVKEAFEQILFSSNRKPKYLQTDEGKEFFNKTLLSWLKAENVILYHNHSPLKAAMIERFNRSLMTRLQKIFTYVLQEVVESYNNSKHRIIGCAPNEVNKYNQMDIWLKSNADILSRKTQKPKFKVGDIVRIKLVKAAFSKGYTSTYSSELYRIKQVNHSKPITYNISDNSDQKILGIFYAEDYLL